MKIKITFAGLLLGLAAAFSQTVPQEDYAAWANMKVFALNTATAGLSTMGTVTGFPLLIRLDASNAADIFAGAKAGGEDLRFRRITLTSAPIPILVKAAALTDHQLPYEIERWDSAARVAEIWVLVDSIYGRRTNQGIAVHWGKADAPARSDPAAVFDTALGFVGVWHMGGNSPIASRNNAVPGGNPAIPSGSSVATGFPVHSGAIGLADTLRNGTGSSITFRTDDDHFNLGSGYSALGPQVTMSLWLKPATPATTAWQVYFALGNGAPGDNLTIGRRANNPTVWSEAYNGTTGGGRTELIDILGFNQWQLVTFVANGPEQILFHNGTQAAISRTTEITVPGVTRAMAYLGRSLWGDPNTAGSYDEARLHKVARSQDWVNLEYHTQRPGSTVLSVVVPPNAPVLGAPAANAVNVPLITSLVWSGVGSATSYRVQLATDTLFAAPVLDEQTIATTRTVGPLAVNTVYYWRVRSIGEAGASGWSAVRRFTTESSSGAVPGAPALSAPAAFAVNVSRTPSLSWAAASGGATSYHAQLSTVPSFASFVVNDSAVSALQRTVGTLAGSTEHYWRVRGKNSAGMGPWSEVRAFTTIVTVPAAPALSSPASFETNVPAASPTLSWSASPGAASYRVQVSLAAAFTSFVVNDSTVTGTSRTLGTLAGFTDYYWRVNAKNPAGTSEFSLARRFTTGEPVAIRVRDIFVTPVHLGAGVHLRFGLPFGEDVSVKLFDARGKLTAVAWEGRLPAGVHTLLLPRTNGGIQLVEFRSGSFRKTLITGPNTGI